MNWKTVGLIAAGVAILLGVLVFFLLRGDVGDGPGRTSGSGEISDPFTFPGEPGGRPATDGEPTREDVLKDYMQWAQYPPDSRPLAKEHRDEIQPQIIKEQPQRMAAIDPETKKPKFSDYFCVLQPVTHTAIGKEPHQLTLRCFKPPGKANVRLEIQEFSLQRRVADKVTRLPSATVSDDGRDGDSKAGDGVYTFQWRPRSVDWGNMEHTVRFSIPDESHVPVRTYQLMASFFSSPQSPAKFTEQVSERIENGSLILSVEMQVQKAGDYEIKANLFAAEEPVAVARARANLKPGRQVVDLLFFGKIFHDRQLAGPYTLKLVRGIRENLAISPSEMAGMSPEEVNRLMEQSTKRKAAGEPDRELIPTWAGGYQTRAYKLSEFSAKEWDGPEKTRRINMLKGFQ